MQVLKTLLLFSTWFAATLSNASVICPKTDVITQMQFLKAEGSAPIWDLFSDHFRDHNRTWQVIYTVYLPNANTSKEALTSGQDFYRYQIAFFTEPFGVQQGHQETCYYAQQQSSYFVRAQSQN